MSREARRLRPISRWISWVLPESFINSRPWRSGVEAGSRRYSALSQPWPEPWRQRGTPSCTQRLQSTRVRPVATINELRAKPIGSQLNVTGRRPWAGRCWARSGAAAAVTSGSGDGLDTATTK